MILTTNSNFPKQFNHLVFVMETLKTVLFKWWYTYHWWYMQWYVDGSRVVCEEM